MNRKAYLLLVLVGKLKIFRLSVLKLIDLPNWGVGIEQYSVANQMQADRIQLVCVGMLQP